MALNNCSINSQSLTKTGGNAIGSDNVQLVITPNYGYSVSASNFTNDTGSIPGINSITLSDSGTPGDPLNTVLVDVDLDDNYIMPSEDTSIIIDINGSADLINTLGAYTIFGKYNTTETNTTTSSTTQAIPYSGGGDYNEQVTLLTKTFTAASGFYFKTEPKIWLLVSYLSKYEVLTSRVYDSENRLTSITFTIKYTFPNINLEGDIINFLAQAEQYYTSTIEISAYSIIQSSLDPIGGTRVMKVYGTEGAEFSLSVQNQNSESILSITDQAIPASGVYEFNVIFPSVANSDQYDFVLTGDLSSNFDTASGQPSTFNIKQLSNVDIAFGLTHSDSGITITSNISKNLLPNTLLSDSDGNFNNEFTISSSSRLNIIDSIADVSEFTNIDILTNGGTDLDITSLLFYRVSNTEITASLNAFVYKSGESSMTSLLNLDDYIETLESITLYPITLGYHPTDPALSYSNYPSGTWYGNSSDFGQCYVLSTTSTGEASSIATAGYYTIPSEGGYYWRYWDGQEFTSSGGGF